MGLKEFIKEKRNASGLSQDALGAKLGISPKTVSNWETGSSNPTMRPLAMARLCEVLNVSVCELAAADGGDGGWRTVPPAEVGWYIVTADYGDGEGVCVGPAWWSGLWTDADDAVPDVIAWQPMPPPMQQVK